MGHPKAYAGGLRRAAHCSRVQYSSVTDTRILETRNRLRMITYYADNSIKTAHRVPVLHTNTLIVVTMEVELYLRSIGITRLPTCIACCRLYTAPADSEVKDTHESNSRLFERKQYEMQNSHRKRAK